MLGKKVALDLGTQSVRLLVKGEASIISEPNVVSPGDGTPAAPGQMGIAALRAATDSGAPVARPIRDGAIADGALLRQLVNQLMVRAVGRQRIFKPDVVVAVMSSMSGDDRRLILDTAMSAGARTVYLIDCVMAGAMGAGAPVTSASGHLAVDVGAGKTDVAVIAMESTIARKSLPGHGGNRLAAAVSAYVRDRHDVSMEPPITEDVVASLLRAGTHEERRLAVTGRRNGGQASATLTSTELIPVLDDHLRPIIGAIQEVLRDTPSTLLDDIHREGIILFGGGSRLEGLNRLLSGVTSIRARVDRDPQLTVIRGAGYSLDNLDVLKRNFMYIR